MGEKMIFPPDFELMLARILLQITPHFQTAYIGGDCLRDMLLKKPIKDIDVFIHVEDMTPKAVGMKLMEAIDGSVGIMVARADDGTAYFSDEVVGVYACGGVAYEGEVLPIQVIALDADMMDGFGGHPVDRFDFGICQIAYINGRIIATEAFRKDANEKTFTVMVKDDSAYRINKAQTRFERLSEKYVGYTLVMPDLVAPSPAVDELSDLSAPPLGQH